MAVRVKKLPQKIFLCAFSLVHFFCFDHICHQQLCDSKKENCAQHNKKNLSRVNKQRNTFLHVKKDISSALSSVIFAASNFFCLNVNDFIVANNLQIQNENRSFFKSEKVHETKTARKYFHQTGGKISFVFWLIALFLLVHNDLHLETQIQL